MNEYNSILIVGPTASGKTKMAVKIAIETNGEIISMDSRQVYKKLNIGSGKDLSEYTIGDQKVNYHLIDIIEPDKKYNISMFVTDFYKAWKKITEKNKIPVLCGGTGLYMDAILKKHQYINVPVNHELRSDLEKKDHNELILKFKSLNTFYNKIADTSTKKRTIRAIEIASYLCKNQFEEQSYPEVKPYILGIDIDLERRRENITRRLHQRLNNGLTEEVRNLIQSGINEEQLTYFGLEYKWITEYVCGKMDKESMIRKLNIEIHRYAKRQMTWFRKMEKEGFKINWIKPETLDEIISRTSNIFQLQQ